MLLQLTFRERKAWPNGNVTLAFDNAATVGHENPAMIVAFPGNREPSLKFETGVSYTIEIKET